ncbi:MAG TPA: NADH-quinone oxidoreductase subunit J [Myxococcaceae bacterium]|nr:NADH-quinone oxidoreductase subunit J [Myxococcaceae bacterium]
MSGQEVLFWLFAFGIVGGAAGVIAARSPITSAMSLVATFFFLAGIYVLLWAHTIAVLQVLVYAGAIMVLFLFVIMLLSLTETGMKGPRLTFGRIVGGLAAAGLLVVLVASIRELPADQAPVTMAPAQAAGFGSLHELGKLLYGTWLLPFEAVSLLLLVAIVGAVVVAKPRI